MWSFVAMLVLACGSGCTSALSTAALREALWANGDHAAEADAEVSDPDARTPAAGDEAILDVADAAEPVDAERRAAAVDEAVNRLARLGPLDAATKATLVETLHRTAQEDWPVVVEAFATTLEATGLPGPRPAVATSDEAESHVVAKADLDAPPQQAPAPAPSPVTSTAESTTTATTPIEPPASSTGDTPADALPTPPSPPAATPAAEAAPALAVRNACFASRVHAWGVVDRFATDTFRPGQEVIVYFELDDLSASESPAGHTTCIDTSLTLVDGRGNVVHDWSFEPIAETCRNRRRDYFARYVVRLPAALPAGPCRLELAVVDTLAGTTARGALPLELIEAAAPAGN